MASLTPFDHTEDDERLTDQLARYLHESYYHELEEPDYDDLEFSEQEDYRFHAANIIAMVRANGEEVPDDANADPLDAQ